MPSLKTYTIPRESIPSCVQALPDAAKRCIEDSLSNDEVSSDDELVQFWQESAQVPEAVGREAVKFRSTFLERPLCTMWPELFR